MARSKVLMAKWWHFSIWAREHPLIGRIFAMRFIQAPSNNAESTAFNRAIVQCVNTCTSQIVQTHRSMMKNFLWTASWLDTIHISCLSLSFKETSWLRSSQLIDDQTDRPSYCVFGFISALSVLDFTEFQAPENDLNGFWTFDLAALS